MHVLLVEDNPGDRRILKKAFEEIDPEVRLHMVETGEEALRFIEKKDEYEESRDPNLILLDLNLPGMHGREVLQQIKKDAKSRKIPVVILSSSPYQKDICDCYESGASSYLNKPPRYSEVLVLVKRLCDFWVREVRYCCA